MNAELERFATLVRELTGNVLPPSRLPYLAELLARRARTAGCENVGAYLDALAAGRLAGEWEALVPLVTIKESSFFRAPQQFEAISRTVLPALLRARAATRRLRVWSAACACGEEAATLALQLCETPELASWDWRVVGTDVDPEALQRARRGLYGDRAVAQVPATVRERHFARRGGLWELDAAVLSRIDYRSLNLATFPYALPDASYDLILVRNVLIYFRRALQRRVLAHMAERLASDGYLFLGASETLWQIQDVMVAVELGDSFCYRHPAAAEPAGQPGRRLAPPTTPAKAAPPRPGPPPAAPAAEPSQAAAAPRPAAADHLLEAVHLIVSDRLSEARTAAAAALAEDASEPSRHVLVGFTCDLLGDLTAAVAAYRAALYLEPTLYQARLLLADCLQRLGDRDRARGQYREVLAALAHGRARELPLLAALPLADRESAARRSRQALGA
ncbi:MAG: CheR family methyltransferase [Acidobacteriota bacterium]